MWNKTSCKKLNTSDVWTDTNVRTDSLHSSEVKNSLIDNDNNQKLNLIEINKDKNIHKIEVIPASDQISPQNIEINHVNIISNNILPDVDNKSDSSLFSHDNFISDAENVNNVQSKLFGNSYVKRERARVNPR